MAQKCNSTINELQTWPRTKDLKAYKSLSNRLSEIPVLKSYQNLSLQFKSLTVTLSNASVGNYLGGTKGLTKQFDKIDV